MTEMGTSGTARADLQPSRFVGSKEPGRRMGPRGLQKMTTVLTPCRPGALIGPISGFALRFFSVFAAIALAPLSVLSAEASSAPADDSASTLTNPLGDPPIHLVDPFILPASKKYFLYGTAPAGDGFQCYESSDLSHWKLDGWAWHLSGLHVARGELHSPKVFSYQGMFCMVYCARMPSGFKLGLAASTRPEGPYHDIHAPWLPTIDGCTDAEVFVDDNRKAYLVFTQKSNRENIAQTVVYGASLNQDLSKIVDQPVKLLEASQRWESARGNLARFNDSPSIFKIGSKYYLTYSANDPKTSERAVGYATADKPMGPWTKNPGNPLVASRQELGLVGPGHGSVFRSLERKEWFVVYESMPESGNVGQERLVNIDTIVLEGIRNLTLKSSTRRSVAQTSATK